MTPANSEETLTLEIFKKQIKWIVKAQMELKILVAGEKDTFWTGDGEEDEKIWKYLNSEELKESGICLLNNESKQYHLRNGAVFSVQAVTISKSTTPLTPRELSEDPRIIISHCPTSLQHSNPLDDQIMKKYLSQAKPRLNVCNHRPMTWGAQVITWPVNDTDSEIEVQKPRPIQVKQQIKEEKNTGEKFVDLRVFGKSLLKNETMMVNACVCPEEDNEEEKKVKPVMLISLDCKYREVVEFVGVGLMESSTKWGKWED